MFCSCKNLTHSLYLLKSFYKHLMIASHIRDGEFPRKFDNALVRNVISSSSQYCNISHNSENDDIIMNSFIRFFEIRINDHLLGR